MSIHHLKDDEFSEMTDEYLTPGLAPSVKKISSGSAGNPSRASIPTEMVSRNPLTPWYQINRVKRYIYRHYSTAAPINERLKYEIVTIQPSGT